MTQAGKPLRLLASGESRYRLPKNLLEKKDDELNLEAGEGEVKEVVASCPGCPEVDNSCLPQLDYAASPGGLFEDDVVRLCRQILAGLSHLEQTQVNMAGGGG